MSGHLDPRAATAPAPSLDSPTRRPLAHITAPRNWLNDPNGPIKVDGRYHLFYQYNPDAPVWGPPHWGHVSSTDLVHWVDEPVALSPQPAGPDRDGCWSGCVRLVDGVPTAFYTGVVETDGVRTESVCVAEGAPDLLTWRQASRPVIAGAPPEITGRYHRDPFLVRTAGGWRMLLGSGLATADGRAGALLAYDSADFEDWSYRGVVYSRPSGMGPIDTGPMWECPQLLSDGTRDALILSNQFEGEPDPLRHVVYAVGRLGADRFVEEAIGRIDHGNAFYAPATLDDGDRTLMWGWVQERRDTVEHGYAGALSLPREVRILGDRVAVGPARELTRLRLASASYGGVEAGAEVELPDAVKSGGPFEVEGRIAPGVVAGLDLVATSGVPYRLEVDGDRALSVRSGDETFAVRLPERGHGHAFRLFVDSSIVELFLDDELALTSRCYSESPRVLRVAGDKGKAITFSVHSLDRCMPDRPPVPST